MNTAFQKTIFLFGLLSLLSLNSMYCQTKHHILAEWSLGDYRITHFVKENDSVVVIRKDIISGKKIENNLAEILDGKIGKKVAQIKVDGKIYWFCYKIESQNGLLINAGEWSPGSAEETIYTYRSLPILVEKLPEK